MSLAKELQIARQRLVGQQSALKETREALASAVKNGLLATQSVLTAKLTRVENAVGKTAAMVKELEKVVGDSK